MCVRSNVTTWLQLDGWMEPQTSDQGHCGEHPPRLLNVFLSLPSRLLAGEAGAEPQAGHRGHGGGGDQVRRLALLRHARGHGPVALLPGPRRQVRPPGSPQETSEWLRAVEKRQTDTTRLINGSGSAEQIIIFWANESMR